MADSVLQDYIQWRGDLSYEQDPFNAVDNAVLCELSYVDFSKVLKHSSPDPVSLKDAYNEIKKKKCFRLMTAVPGKEDFVAEAAKSKRFGEMKLTFFNETFDHDTTQFAAIHFELTPTLSYIAFRGTDNSIIGWKEDFMMSFQRIPAQKKAVYYLVGTMNDKKEYFVGGHSKGGNLAVYAVSYLTNELQKRIRRVYVNDGPGFSPDVYDMERIGRIEPLVTRIAPEYDIIGQLFNRGVENKTRFVRSTEKGILQHDLVSWRVKGNRFDFAPEMDASAKFICGALNDWIEKADEAGRKAFVNALFASFSVRNAVHFDDLNVWAFPEVLKTLMEASPEAKNVAMELPKSYLNAAKKQISEYLTTTVEEAIAASQKNKQAEETDKENHL